MLGLQQTAAQNASAMQNDYAAAMAAAQENAMGIQNTRGQIGATIAASDLASEAQKYAANMSAALSDPYRLFTEVQDLIDDGKDQEAKYLLSIYAASSGMSADAIKDLVDNWTYAPNTQAPETDTNGDGTIDNNDAPAKPSPSVPSLQTGGLDVQLNNYNDAAGKNFNINIGDTKYSNLELMDEEDKNSNAWKIAKAKKVGDGQMFVYDDKLYVRKNEKIYRVGDAGLDPNSFLGGFWSRYNEYDTGNVAKIKEYLRQNGYSYDSLGNTSTALPKATLKNYKARTGENFNANFAGENYKGLEVGTKYGADSPEANAAKGVEDGQFFLYNGEVYLKSGSDAYRIGGTGTKGTDNEGKSGLFLGKTMYTQLREALKNAGYTDLASGATPQSYAGLMMGPARAEGANTKTYLKGRENQSYKNENWADTVFGFLPEGEVDPETSRWGPELATIFGAAPELYAKALDWAEAMSNYKAKSMPAQIEEYLGIEGFEDMASSNKILGKLMDAAEYINPRQWEDFIKEIPYPLLVGAGALGAGVSKGLDFMSKPEVQQFGEDATQKLAEFFANLVLESKQRTEYKKNKISTGLNALQDLISERKKR